MQQLLPADDFNCNFALKIKTVTTFKALGLHKNLVQGITEMGIETPTEIQEKAIPFLLTKGTDFIGQAQTGTGKTAAFGLPILQKIDVTDNATQALVLCPTRELGQQIAKQFFKYTKYTEKIFTEAVYGGEKIDKQIAALSRTTHIVVATPGRLLDLMKRKVVNLDKVKTIVLDEADEMLSIGFKMELDEILSRIGERKNIWLFSATMSEGIQKIIKKYMKPDAQRVEISRGKIVNEQISHNYVISEASMKLQTLLSFLQSQRGERGIVFCKTKAATQTLEKQLKSRNVEVAVIHGDLMQKEREKAMRAFINEKANVLVATDISARGIDVSNLAFVVHYQLPDQIEYYTHRSGRTGRGGKSGMSLCIIEPSELQRIKKIGAELNIHFKRIAD
ncbi:MAG: DEAD/DEAH box helicase [Cyclobacteriaceae bacterium]